MRLIRAQPEPEIRNVEPASRGIIHPHNIAETTQNHTRRPLVPRMSRHTPQRDRNEVGAHGRRGLRLPIPRPEVELEPGRVSTARAHHPIPDRPIPTEDKEVVGEEGRHVGGAGGARRRDC